MSRPLRVSYSVQDCYDQCEVKAGLKYIDRVKPFIPIRYPLVTGVAFHELVDSMYRTEQFDVKYLTRNWPKYYETALENEGSLFASTDDAEKYKKYGYGLLYKFFNFAKAEGYLTKPLYSEWSFELVHQGVTITGKVDLIIRRAPHLPVEILDFKTGWTVHDIKLNKQLSIYDWAVKSVLQYDQTSVGLFYPRKASIVTDTRTPEQHSQVLTQLIDLHGKLTSGNLTPNLEHCAKCEFSKYCKFFVPPTKAIEIVPPSLDLPDILL